MSSILLVEDDHSLGSTLRERLERDGYQIAWVRTKTEALALFEQQRFDLCILDISLPDGSGMDLARDIRMRSNAAFIFLTAMNTAEHRLEGYELGAEEFIPKPFFLKELLLRVQRVLGRSSSASELLRIGGLEIDFKQRSLRFPDGAVEFPPTKDFSLLKLLIDSAPAALSREEIREQIWGSDSKSTARTVDNSIMRLRQSLRRAEQDCIRSVRGVGYQWISQ